MESFLLLYAIYWSINKGIKNKGPIKLKSENNVCNTVYILYESFNTKPETGFPMVISVVGSKNLSGKN